jgi:biopolymer transport protein ExbD
MIKKLLSHKLQNILIATTILLSGALTALGAEPTTRPATQRSKDPVINLRSVLPAGWSLQGTVRIARTDMHPGRSWSRVPTAYMKLRSTLVQTREGLQRETPPVIVWMAQQQAKKAKWVMTEIQQDIEQKSTEYLGAGSRHHIYIHLPTATAKLWPTARRDIAKALGIKAPTTQPAEPVEPGEERSIVLVRKNGASVSYSVNDIACGNIKAVGEAMAKLSKDTPLIIQIETNVPYKRVAEILGIARKLRLTKVSISVAKTSTPPTKPKWKPPL